MSGNNLPVATRNGKEIILNLGSCTQVVKTSGTAALLYIGSAEYVVAKELVDLLTQNAKPSFYGSQ